MSVSHYIALGSCIGTAIAYQAYQTKVAEIEALSFELREQIRALTSQLDHKNHELSTLTEESSIFKLSQDTSHRDIIRGLRSETATLVREKEALFSKLSSITADKEALEKSEAALKKTISDLGKAQSASEAEFQNIKDAFKFKLNNEVERLNASQGMEVTELKKQVKELREQASAKDSLYSQLVDKSAAQMLKYEKENESFKEEASRAVKGLTSLQESCDKFKATSAEKKTAFESEISQLKEELDYLKKELVEATTGHNTTKEKNAESEKSLAEFEKKHATSVEEKNDLEASNGKLKLKTKEQEETIADLEKFKKSLETELEEAAKAKEEVTELRATIKELQSATEVLENEKKDAERAKEELEEEKNSQAAIIEKLETSNLELTTETANLREEMVTFEALKTSNKASETENNVSLGEVEDLKSKLFEIESEFNAYKEAKEKEDQAKGKDDDIAQLKESLAIQEEMTTKAQKAVTEKNNKIERLEIAAIAAEEEYKKSIWAVEVNLRVLGALLQGDDNLQRRRVDFLKSSDILEDDLAKAVEESKQLKERAEASEEESGAVRVQKELDAFRAQLAEFEAKKESELTKAVETKLKEYQSDLQNELDDLRGKHKSQLALVASTLERLKKESAKREEIEAKLKEALQKTSTPQEETQ